MTREEFIFNGVNSRDLKIIVLEGPPTEINNEEYEEVIVDGRNGSLIINKGTYPNLNKPFKVTILEDEAEYIYGSIDTITDWLTNITDNKLIYEREDRCYLVKKVIIEDIYTTFEEFGDFAIQFICEPFKYEINESLITINNSEDIYYSGTAPGEANFKIYGNGNIQFTINDETVQINNVDEYVELDSKLLLCINKDKTSKSRDMIGEFPLLTRGENKISWVGNVSKLEILPRIAYK